MSFADEPIAQTVVLRADDHFVSRWSAPMNAHVWAVKSRGPINKVSTLLNLYVLLSAVRLIESIQPLHVDDYAIGALGGEHCTTVAAASPPLPAASGLTSLLRNVGASQAVGKLQLNMASQMEQCHAALAARGELEVGLPPGTQDLADCALL